MHRVADARLEVNKQGHCTGGVGAERRIMFRCLLVSLADEDQSKHRGFIIAMELLVWTRLARQFRTTGSQRGVVLLARDLVVLGET